MHFLILKTYFCDIENAFNFSYIKNQILISKNIISNTFVLENEFIILNNLCNFLIRKYIEYLISGNEFLILKKNTIKFFLLYQKITTIF